MCMRAIGVWRIGVWRCDCGVWAVFSVDVRVIVAVFRLCLAVCSGLRPCLRASESCERCAGCEGRQMGGWPGCGREQAAGPQQAQHDA